MNGILFLGEEDFVLRRGEQGNLLSLAADVRSLVLILFYSNECPHCDNLINKFKQLPQLLNGCLFAMVNVNRNMSLVEKSQNTVAPITFVPDVILYVNGNPYIRYDGPHEISNIRDFIYDIYQKMQKTAFMENQQSRPPSQPETGGVAPTMNQQPPQQPEIPAYTIGKPISGEWKSDRHCYLNFQSAYVTNKA